MDDAKQEGSLSLGVASSPAFCHPLTLVFQQVLLSSAVTLIFSYYSHSVQCYTVASQLTGTRGLVDAG